MKLTLRLILNVLILCSFCACSKEAYKLPRPLKPGWYQWSDQANSPAGFSPPAMAQYDMSARCLCDNGFYVKDLSPTKFIVVKAPDGYSDTLGKVFLSKEHICFNCAD